MKNYSRAGYVRTMVAAVVIAGGDIVQSGVKAAIATGSAAVGEEFEANLGGVYEVKKSNTLALVQGQSYDWDATAKQVVASGTGDFAIGEADVAADAGAETGFILLNGLPYAFC